jgi:DNA invertase Pin-like site-specific DNA recombinase
MFVRLVAYIRVSTAAQVEEGAGLEVQEQAIARWADGAGHNVAATFRDEGISGTKDVEGRPGLNAALAAVADGAAGGLVVYKLDRLARVLTVQEACLAQVWKYGARVFAVDLGEVLQDDPDDPMRTAMRQMVGVFAQLERGMTVFRLRTGRKHKAERGGYAYGSPRFGQRAEDRELAPDGDEQATIARIADLRDQGRSLRDIVTVLDAEGRRPKRGARWHPQTVARVLSRLDEAS